MAEGEAEFLIHGKCFMCYDYPPARQLPDDGLIHTDHPDIWDLYNQPGLPCVLCMG